MENIVQHDVHRGLLRAKCNGWEEEIVNRSKAIFPVEFDERRQGAADFYVETNFLPRTRVPFYILSRRSSPRLTVFFFFNLAFVTRDIIIALWIPVTAYDWQAIVDALCKFYRMIIAMGYSTMDPLPTDRLFSFKAPA